MAIQFKYTNKDGEKFKCSYGTILIKNIVNNKKIINKKAFSEPLVNYKLYIYKNLQSKNECWKVIGSYKWDFVYTGWNIFKECYSKIRNIKQFKNAINI